MKQCEDIMAKLEESAKQPNQRHEQNGSSSSGHNGCLQTERTLMKGSREAGGREQRDACVQTMTTSETGAVHDKEVDGAWWRHRSLPASLNFS